MAMDAIAVTPFLVKRPEVETTAVDGETREGRGFTSPYDWKI